MKHFLIGLGSLILLGAVFVIVSLVINSQPLTEEKGLAKMQAIVERAVKSEKVSSGLVRVVAPEKGIDVSLVAGESYGEKTEAGQAFHVASVGKMFTATLVGMLVDEGQLGFDDLITPYFEAGMLDGLFVFEGVDYQDEVTVGMLLQHTSGLADYFEDEGRDGMSGAEWLLADATQFWTPMMIVDFTRDSQEAVGPAGAQFHYSDTGYILLGMMVEELMGMPLGDALADKIFEPLGMKDSYLLFYGEAMSDTMETINEVWLEGVEVHDFESLSIDWAGGGVISTLDDLVLFAKGLNEGDLLSEETLARLYQFDEQFMRGIYYGLGMMEYRFEEFMPMVTPMPHYRGHMGILGTHLLYDAGSGTILVASFGSSEYAAGSVRSVIQILAILDRIE